MEGSLVSESAKQSNMLLKKKLRKILKSRKSTIWIVSLPEREKRGKKKKREENKDDKEIFPNQDTSK